MSYSMNEIFRKYLHRFRLQLYDNMGARCCNLCRISVLMLMYLSFHALKAEITDTMTVYFQRGLWKIDETYRNNSASLYRIDNILPQSRYAQCLFFADSVKCEIQTDTLEVQHSDALFASSFIDKAEPVQAEVSMPLKPTHWGITTNLLHWVTLAHNVGVEYAPNNRNTLGLSGSCAWFSNKSKHKVYRWMVGELSYHHYFRSYDALRGGFVGLYAQTGEFELMFSPRNRKGEFISAGLCGGYMWKLKEKLYLEVEAGVGYMYVDYRHAKDINGVLIRQGRNYRNYVLPSRISLTLIYRFKK